MGKLKIFADGAVIDDMIAARDSGKIDGFTTNPTLMRKAGVTDYVSFAKSVLEEIKDCPVCFEVFADDFDEMYRQAEMISSWGDNVYVKIPVTNTNGESSAELISRLGAANVKINVTAILDLDQVRTVTDALEASVPAIVSVFAGRIADTGLDPVPIMTEAVKILKDRQSAELLWASPREVLNVYQAEECGCHIITITNDLFKKLSMRGKDLGALSRETVRMFYDDARESDYHL